MTGIKPLDDVQKLKLGAFKRQILINYRGGYIAFMAMQGLYARGRVLIPADVHDAYTYAGVFYGCTNYRILNLGSLLKAPPVRRGADLSEFVHNFIAESGEVLGVGNKVNGVVHFMVLKSLNEKNFLTIG